MCIEWVTYSVHPGTDQYPKQTREVEVANSNLCNFKIQGRIMFLLQIIE
jgi:hypothetical protein